MILVNTRKNISPLSMWGEMLYVLQKNTKIKISIDQNQ